MGFYINTGSAGFKESIRSKIYVDKTGLAAYTNSIISTKQKYACVSRPRRFGKTMAAEMLMAYYGCGEDTRELFTPYEIARAESFEAHLNKYDVILVNIQNELTEAGQDVNKMLRSLETVLLRDLTELYTNLVPHEISLYKALSNVSQNTGRQFVVLIDEWDAIFRVNPLDTTAQKAYLDFLRMFLKDRTYIALAYMTGILPIRKYGTHSALNMFTEYSMTDPREMAPYMGFTQEEVSGLCLRFDMDVEAVKSWYNGYSFRTVQAIYNPKSVVEAMTSRYCGNYWVKTETYEALKVYIEMDYDGLRDAIVRLLSGERLVINSRSFVNDMVTFSNYMDVLTLLVHLGYLGYTAIDNDSGEVFIPNKEIADEFSSTLSLLPWGGILARAISASRALLAAALRGDAASVAAGVEAAHFETSQIQYNDENALSYTLSLAFFAAREEYVMIRELPSGRGFADIVFIPRTFAKVKKALLFELKWDDTADSAIAQIKRKQYPRVLEDFKGHTLLVGVSYDKKTKEHACVIEADR